MNNIFALLPLVIQLVKQVEVMMPNSAGVDKANAVIASVEAMCGTLGPMLPIIQSFITVVVGGFNSLGLFHKATAPAAHA